MKRINIKGTVAREFLPLVFSWIDPIWAPNSHPEIFSNSRRYLYTKIVPRVLIPPRFRSAVSYNLQTLFRGVSDPRNNFQFWISKNSNKIRKYFNVLIRGPYGVTSWKNPEIENIVLLYLQAKNNKFNKIWKELIVEWAG